ncbi:DrmB family protein [Streptomyces mirabilis]|uniref:DrmB family protein n=1 Tax=Streptomyces mirabilis TaxID=68239 RepID=UPI00369A81B2
MIRGKVRRSQLVAPFGPGAMQVLADGTSVITAGLDHWFIPGEKLDQEEFRIHEWRLERHLGVEALYTPPDHRSAFKSSPDQYNTKLQVPVLRFPAWSFCPRCRELTSHPLHIADRPRCTNPDCPKQKASWAPFLAQVPFVALCERGHLQDFPWVEWVHKTANPNCRSPKLKLRTSGGGTLASQRVVCETCHGDRGLEGITSVERPNREHEDETTYLTTHLENGTEFSCRGAMPWLGLATAGEPCGAPLRGSLRSASNVYYALVKSSIFIPEASSAGVDTRVLEALEEQTIARARANVRDVLEEGDILTASRLRRAAKKNAFRLADFTDAQVEAALSILEGPAEASLELTAETVGDQAPFRFQEYTRIRDTIDSTELVVREPRAGYAKDVGQLVSRVRLVEKLRETRVLWGFNRIFAESPNPDTAARMALLRRQSPEDGESWLPAYTVLGEGIYLELDPGRLAKWEVGPSAQNPAVQDRLAPIAQQFQTVARERHLAERQVTPRLVLLHTLAHLLINQLTFECGYSSASLRERLYVSPGIDGMNGLLIYTAAGDSEGTLGGLVRMGQPERFEEILRNAINNARWCSSDPVCIDSHGQGPDSCNLAACHSCALLPETACEEFNRFLDRGLVAGTLSDPELGFFSSLA